MSIKLTGSILADHLEGLRAKASPGPWETDTIEGDGFKSAAIYAGRHATAPVILDSLNSEAATLEEDYDDEGHAMTFDRQAIDNVAFIKALENNFETILEALRAVPERICGTCHYRQKAPLNDWDDDRHQCFKTDSGHFGYAVEANWGCELWKAKGGPERLAALAASARDLAGRLHRSANINKTAVVGWLANAAGILEAITQEDAGAEIPPKS